MMFRVNVAAVSYLNTIPFIYGLEHAELLRANLLLSPPALCTANFISGEADIALIPVATIPPLMEQAKIITSFCIGASAPVRTVTLMSNQPIEQIDKIHLDDHSRTSAMLVKVLCEQLWGIAPQWLQLNDYSVVDSPKKGEAFLLIGDKVFDYEGRFKYTYDLAEQWINLTSLPFVFAAWVARTDRVSDEVINALERSLEFGVAHTPEAIAYYGHSGKPYALQYLTENIDFRLDEQKRRALSLFWEMSQRLDLHAQPG